MSEDRSLTDFSSSDGAVAETERGDESEPTGPATVTYRWQPAGAVCAECSASTETQWLDDGEFVCPDCKSWE